MVLRVFDAGRGVVNPMHTLNLSGEEEGEKNGKIMEKKKYLQLLLNIMCDKLQRM